METIVINSFSDFTSIIEDKDKHDLILFRGQKNDKNLLPKIARPKGMQDTTETERKMIKELKRRIGELSKSSLSTDWDWLALAQHHSMSTRLLDWTTNPLVALWFACHSKFIDDNYSVVWVFIVPDDALLDIEKDKSPFDSGKTKVYQPKVVGRRLESQSGWFTVHKFSKNAKRFVSFEYNKEYKDDLIKIKITKKNNLRTILTDALDTCGINSSSIFPDLDGLCRHIDWKYLG